MQPGVSVLSDGGKEDYREIFVSAFSPTKLRDLQKTAANRTGSGEGMTESCKHIQ